MNFKTLNNQNFPKLQIGCRKNLQNSSSKSKLSCIFIHHRQLLRCPNQIKSKKSSGIMADEVSQASGASAAVSAAETYWWTGLAGQEHVTKLTEENMEPFLKNHERVLVMFYAPWCTGLLLSSEEGSTTSKLAAVDCTKHPRLHHLFKVRGYPTFKFFHQGVEKGIYNGGRKSHEIVNFMLRRN